MCGVPRIDRHTLSLWPISAILTVVAKSLQYHASDSLASSACFKCVPCDGLFARMPFRFDNVVSHACPKICSDLQWRVTAGSCSRAFDTGTHAETFESCGIWMQGKAIPLHDKFL